MAQQSACGGDTCILDASMGGPPNTAPPAAVVRATRAATDPRCPAIPVDVIADSAEEHRMACSSASTALELLGQCGIAPRRPLRLEVLHEVRHPFGKHSIFGFFDPKPETVFVTQEASVPSLVVGTPYSELPRRDFFHSLIVHEVVHSVMHQNFRRQPTSHAAYEYPAYALQIKSLPPNIREQFLQFFEQDAIRADTMFNDSVLMFDPFSFAAQAYRHFKAAGADGCAHLNALLDGEAPFILTMPLR
jgi:hypothetical protein